MSIARPLTVAALITCGCGPRGAQTGAPGRPASAALDCKEVATTNFGEVVVAGDAARSGPRGTTFSSSPSSFAAPIETCGVRGQLEILMSLTCDDGSHPFSDLEQAHRSRAGSADGGGRCRKPVDLYKVACPEKTYDVYMDLYVCTRAEVDASASTLSKLVDDGFEVVVPPGFDAERTDWGAMLRNYAGASVAIVAGLGAADFDVAAAESAARRALGLPANLPAGHETKTAAGVLTEVATAVGGKAATAMRLAPASDPNRVLLLVAPRGSPLVGRLGGKLGDVVASFARSEHHYQAYEDLAVGDASELFIVNDARDGVSFLYPKDWSVVVKSPGDYMARIDTDSGNLAFTHHRLPLSQLPGSLSARDVTRSLVTSFVNSKTVVIVYAGAGGGDSEADSYRVVLVRGESWTVIVTEKTKSYWLISSMGGDRRSFFGRSAILLAEAITSATAVSLEPDGKK